MPTWQIEALNDFHQRADFSCGNPGLDNFLHHYVNQYEKRHLGRTYIILEHGKHKVQGYYTLATGAVEFENLPRTMSRKLPKHPVPVILLARLAVNNEMKGLGLGALLLQDALKRSLSLADHLGIFAVKVDAFDQQAESFYRKFGFLPLQLRRNQLIIAIATIEKASS